MAAPGEKTIQNLSGKWAMNRDLSDDADGVLVLQGFSYLTRCAIANSDIHLKIKQTGEDEETVIHIDAFDGPDSDAPTIKEDWALDWQDREVVCDVMGKVKTKARWITLDNLEQDKEFLELGWLKKGKWHVETWQGSKVDGWMTHQVWGFENSENDQRRFTQRSVVKNGDQMQQVKVVYDWVGME